MAIKIVQKKQQYTEQAQMEINILQQLHLPQQHDATKYIGALLLKIDDTSLDWWLELFLESTKSRSLLR